MKFSALNVDSISLNFDSKGWVTLAVQTAVRTVGVFDASVTPS